MATPLQQVSKLFSKIGACHCPQLQTVGQKQRSQPDFSPLKPLGHLGNLCQFLFFEAGGQGTRQKKWQSDWIWTQARSVPGLLCHFFNPPASHMMRWAEGWSDNLMAGWFIRCSDAAGWMIRRLTQWSVWFSDDATDALMIRWPDGWSDDR